MFAVFNTADVIKSDSDCFHFLLIIIESLFIYLLYKDEGSKPSNVRIARYCKVFECPCSSGNVNFAKKIGVFLAHKKMWFLQEKITQQANLPQRAHTPGPNWFDTVTESAMSASSRS